MFEDMRRDGDIVALSDQIIALHIGIPDRSRQPNAPMQGDRFGGSPLWEQRVRDLVRADHKAVGKAQQSIRIGKARPFEGVVLA